MRDIFFKYMQDPNTWMSIIAITISLIALFQTAKQIKLSNKQHCFDRRIEKYMFVRDLLKLYKDNRVLFINNKSICETVDFPFVMLTNCASLESMGAAISTPLHKETHKEYLLKIEMIDKYAAEIKLLWDTEEGCLASRFVYQYKEFLHAMYKQQIWLKKQDETYNPNNPPLLDEFQKQANDMAINTQLFDAIDNIEKTYHKIVEKDIEQHMIKSLRL